MAAEIVPATEAHARSMAPHMRAEDAAECDAAVGLAPLPSLLESLKASEYSRALVVDGEVVVIWGVAPGPMGIGVVWALTATSAPRHGRAIAELAPAEVAAMLARYGALTNAVDARHASALRWVRSLGFVVGAALPFGARGLPFHPIALMRSPNV